MQKKLNGPDASRCAQVASMISGSFVFQDTPDGRAYWRGVCDRLVAMAKHGTTDGKPWVKPVRVPTDEDAKQRPQVLVRDGGDVWEEGWTLLAVKSGSFPFVTKMGDRVTAWRQCRFPDEETADSAASDPVAAETEQPAVKEWVQCNPYRWTNAVEFAEVPADHDAYHRPLVMVLDSDGAWHKRPLVAVASGDCPFVTMNDLGSIERWEHCRFPIEGE